jgi:hypothetical protein
MDTVLAGLPFIFVYLDNILVASATREEHLADLTMVFDRLEKHGLVVHPGKCVFGVTEVDFLGHHVTKEGMTPLASRVKAVREFPQPKTIKALQGFLGMVNFYHRFIPKAALVLCPLYSALAGKPTRTSTVTWSAEMEHAFTTVKNMLADAAVLVHPQTEAVTAVTVDASDIAVGGVLEQRIDSQWQPLAFYRKQLQPTQRKYSAFDRELLAAHLGIRHFQHFLEGRQFTIYTDHIPFTSAFSEVSDAWSARQQRQLSAVSAFTTDLRHVSGRTMW